MTELELREYVNNTDSNQSELEKQNYERLLHYLEDKKVSIEDMQAAVKASMSEEKLRLKTLLSLADKARLNLNRNDYDEFFTYVRRNFTNEEKEKLICDVIKNVINIYKNQDEVLMQQIDSILSEIDKTNNFDTISKVDSLSNLIIDKQSNAKYRSLYFIYKADSVKEKNVGAAYDFLNSATDYISDIEDVNISSKLRIKQADTRRKLIKIAENNKYNKPLDSNEDELKDKISKINKLLNRAEEYLDEKALEDAIKLIETLENSKEKENLTKRAKEISKQIIENNIHTLLDKAEKNLNRSDLNRACELINKLPNGDNKNDFQARAAEINELIKNKENSSSGSGSDEEPEQPVIHENSPSKTWKTWVALAAGIGVGSAVFFTCGTVGVSVMAIAGGITKRLVAKRRKKLELQRLNGNLPVESVEEPLPGIKGKIQDLKKYFKSEEFCRDATWFLNGAIYTGLALNVASSIYNLASSKMAATSNIDANITNNQPSTDIVTNHQPSLDSSYVNTDPTSGITIGDKVGNYNVTVGHDTASWATSGSHTENLISEYVNGGSIFKRFAVMNPDGSVAQMVNTNGLSITDFCAQSGIDPSQIAVDVANKDGVSQAWVSVSELIKGVGGKSL